jgi:preprotein translocase subunit SecY
MIGAAIIAIGATKTSMVHNPVGNVRTWVRILVTVALLAVFRLAALLPLPGIDTNSLERLGGSFGVNVVALGITPFVTAFVVVEQLSFVLPIGGSLRRRGIAGRSKINTFAIRVGLGLALMQAAAIATALQHIVTPSGGKRGAESRISFYPVFRDYTGGRYDAIVHRCETPVALGHW